MRQVSSHLAAFVRATRVTTCTAAAQMLARSGIGGKSLRRRLYDSLKVLAAAGAIARGRAAGTADKHLRWLGTKHLSMLGAARARVRAKRAHRDELSARLSLARRNCSRADTELGKRVHVPFVVVRTMPNACIALAASPDSTMLSFRFDSYFEVMNDSALIDRLLEVDAAHGA